MEIESAQIELAAITGSGLFPAFFPIFPNFFLSAKLKKLVSEKSVDHFLRVCYVDHCWTGLRERNHDYAEEETSTFDAEQ